MTECVPAARVLVLKVATPEPLRVPVPSAVEPSRKFTVPVGVPTAGGFAETVAVKVTDCPNVLGLGLEFSVVVVPGPEPVNEKLLTTC